MSDERPVALVTGAGSGIGRCTATALAKPDHGSHRLVLAGRRESTLHETGALLGERGTDWAALPTDLADADQATSLVRRAADAFGRLDAVVNNAGWAPLKPAWELSRPEIEAILAVNTVAPMLISVEALKHFRRAGIGRLIQVSSMASDDPFPGLSVYGGAKAALNTLTKGIWNELQSGESSGAQSSSIRVFCVAPGAVETDLLRSIISEDDLPSDACLLPESVAEVIADCASGKRDAESGQTIWMPSPS